MHVQHPLQVRFSGRTLRNYIILKTFPRLKKESLTCPKFSSPFDTLEFYENYTSLPVQNLRPVIVYTHHEYKLNTLFEIISHKKTNKTCLSQLAKTDSMIHACITPFPLKIYATFLGIIYSSLRRSQLGMKDSNITEKQSTVIIYAE